MNKSNHSKNKNNKFYEKIFRKFYKIIITDIIKK